jgi:hypothetical protein
MLRLPLAVLPPKHFTGGLMLVFFGKSCCAEALFNGLQSANEFHFDLLGIKMGMCCAGSRYPLAMQRLCHQEEAAQCLDITFVRITSAAFRSLLPLQSATANPP